MPSTHPHESLYKPFLPPDQQWPEFLAQILHIDTYVEGNIELMALATVLQTRIRILSRPIDGTNTEVVREITVPPRPSEDSTHTILSTITLVHYPGDGGIFSHYRAMVPPPPVEKKRPKNYTG